MKRFLEKYHLFPKHTEVSLFLMFLSLSFVLFSEPDLRSSTWNIAVSGEGSFIFAVISLAGALLSVYYAFNLKRGPSRFARFFMITFAVVIQAQAGLLLAAYHLENPSTWNLIFATLNGLQAFFLLFMYRAGKINEDSVSNYNAKSRELIVGGLAITIIYIFTVHILNLAWQLSYSILITYSVTINNLFVRTRDKSDS